MAGIGPINPPMAAVQCTNIESCAKRSHTYFVVLSAIPQLTSYSRKSGHWRPDEGRAGTRDIG